jgi:opacity protein-like surface antigen
MKKALIFIFLTACLAVESMAQYHEQSGLSFAAATGIGFKDINHMNGGAYAKNTIVSGGYDFHYSPLYWSGAFAVKHELHEFGIEYEQLKYSSEFSQPLGVNIQMHTVSSLKMYYFNFYYKFLFPIEWKKINPYVKGGLNLNIYTYRYDRDWTDSYGGPGTDFSSTTGLWGSFSAVAGANYIINDHITAFAEMGYGPVLFKAGMRLSIMHNL